MGRFRLDKRGVEKIRMMLETQVEEVQRRLACTAYDYFVNFAYKKDGGGPVDGGGGWTLYYISNWNVWKNGINTTVSPAERVLQDEEGTPMVYHIDREKARWQLDDLLCGDSVTVTNSVWYGPILNSGGVFGSSDVCVPNRFLELCQGHLQDKVVSIVNQVAKECPDL